VNLPAFLRPVGPIQNQVVDTRDAVQPIAQPQSAPERLFSLRNLFPSFNRSVNGRPVIGQSQFPTPTQLPDANYLNAFQYQRPGRPGFWH